MDLNTHSIIRKYIASNAFGKLIGMDFFIEEKGKVSYTVRVSESLLATPRAIHGGVIASLCDGALGIAALSSVCELQQVVATIEMNIKYLKPALLGDTLTAQGLVVSQGKRILVSEVKVYNQDQVLISIGTGTFNAYPAEKAGY